MVNLYGLIQRFLSENISDAERYFDAINTNPFGNTAGYTTTPTPTMNKEINVSIGAKTTTLSPIVVSDTPPRTPPRQWDGEWDGEEFTDDDDNIESRVWSNSKSNSDYYPTVDRGRSGSILHDDELSDNLVESIYNRRFIKITDESLFNEYSILRLPDNKDINDDGSLDEAVVAGYFNGVKGTFICSGTKSTREPLNKPIKIDHARCWVVMSGIYPLKRANRRQKWC